MNAEVTIAARVSRPVYAQILKRQRAVAQLTGIRPSVSAVVRQMIEEASRVAGARASLERDLRPSAKVRRGCGKIPRASAGAAR